MSQRREKKSPYRMGWIVAMFDLPVCDEEERREATLFRKSLMNDGFVMIQFSVYARPCVSLEKLKKHEERVRNFAPRTGDVRLLFFTDRQWEESVLIVRKDKTPKQLEKIPEQIEFW